MQAKDYYNLGLSYYALDTQKKNTVVAMQHFEDAAIRGYPDAYYFLGRFYAIGDGVSIDLEKAFSLYHEGYKQKSSKCTYAIGLAHYTGAGVLKDEQVANVYFEEAFSTLQEEAKDEDAVSIYLIGTYYYYGFFIKRFLLKAIEYFTRSADLHYADAQYMMGMIYETIYKNEDEKDNQKKAEAYYLKAAKQDHPFAQYALGINAIETGNIKKAKTYLLAAANQNYALAQFTLGKIAQSEKRLEAAFDWFLKAAHQENAKAEYHVGLCYHFGLGVKKQIEEAVRWYFAATKQMEVEAFYQLGSIYIQHYKDFQTAFNYLDKAAALNHPEAQYNLAVMYQKGDGVQQNMDLAFKWFKEGAERGSARAQYNLGMMYYEGIVIEKDEQKAKSWWEKAAAQNLEVAVKQLLAYNNYQTLYKSKWQS